MMPALASEGYLLRNRPLPYVLGAAWTAMVVGFAFVVPYAIYLALDPATNPDRGGLLQIVLPGEVHRTALGSYPMFGGAVMLILGALVTGSEDRWGTWKVRFTQGPSRSSVMTAKFVAAGLAACLMALVALLGAIAASLLIATLAGASLSLPTIPALMTSLGAATLIAVAWTSVGMALGVIFKGATVAIAVGLIWTLALENLLSGLAGILPALEPVRALLLSTASGSLVGSTGAPLQGAGGTPGVVDHLSAGQSVVVLVGYTVAALAISNWLMLRRDIT